MTKPKDPDLSVVISTWNNASRVRITLEALARCRTPQGCRWELVLVNNNCTDDTDGIVERHAGNLPLVYVHEPRPGLSNGRNAGLAVARGRLIVFTDDDVEPCEDWLAIFWKTWCDKPSGWFFGGPVESDYEGEPLDAALLRWAPPSVKGFDLGPSPRVLEPNESFISANWACSRKALLSVGGCFDATKGLNPAAKRVGVGEETELMRRLTLAGLKGWYLPNARLRHFVPTSKCTLSHIGSRWQANRREDALDRGIVFGRVDEGLRTTVWLNGSICKWWLKWLLARAMARKGYGEYIAWRTAKGGMEGIAERRKAAKGKHELSPQPTVERDEDGLLQNKTSALCPDENSAMSLSARDV